MENYSKGKNVEEEFTLDKIPIPNLPENVLWMQLRSGTKIRNSLTYALEEFRKRRAVVWSGSGAAVGKTVTCAEIMKRECGNGLHQISKVCFRTVEEYWDPLIEQLDQLVIKRRLPTLHILLSKDPLDQNEPGYQMPTLNRPLNIKMEISEAQHDKQEAAKRRKPKAPSNKQF